MRSGRSAAVPSPRNKTARTPRHAHARARARAQTHLAAQRNLFQPVDDDVVPRLAALQHHLDDAALHHHGGAM